MANHLQGFVEDIFVCPPPTLSIVLSQYFISLGETATITFTFNRVPTGFSQNDVTVENGILVDFTQTENPLVYSGLFIPNADIFDDTNIIRVGSGWTDRNGNAPSGITNSSNYVIDTIYHFLRITTDGNYRITSDGYRRRVVVPDIFP